MNAAKERCCAVVGTATSGPKYCGNRARAGVDANGRPVCKIHLKNQVGIEWFGERGRYPYGFGGDWKFAKGEYPHPVREMNPCEHCESRLADIGDALQALVDAVQNEASRLGTLPAKVAVAVGHATRLLERG